MKLFTVEFDDRDVPVVEAGVAVGNDGGGWSADIGTDVGGATLAMIRLRIPVAGVEPADGRLTDASVHVSEDGKLAFGENDGAPAAFVILSVIQRSPDARTEVEPYPEGVTCIGNAYERPMDRQVLTMEPGTRVRFRRFGRGGLYGRWYALTWDGASLAAVDDEPPAAE